MRTGNRRVYEITGAQLLLTSENKEALEQQKISSFHSLFTLLHNPSPQSKVALFTAQERRKQKAEKVFLLTHSTGTAKQRLHQKRYFPVTFPSFTEFFGKRFTDNIWRGHLENTALRKDKTAFGTQSHLLLWGFQISILLCRTVQIIPDTKEHLWMWTVFFSPATRLFLLNK